MPFEVEISHGVEDIHWDQFVNSVDGAHPEQTTGWAYARALNGWDAVRIRLHENGHIVGGAQLLHQPVGKLGSMGYVPRGPCLGRTDDALARQVVDEIITTARRLNVVYLVIDPPYTWQALLPHLEKASFRRSPKGFPPATLMDATLVIDLSPPLEKIFAGFRHTARKHIRRSAAKVSVRSGSEADIDTFFGLMLATSSRRDEAPVPATSATFHRLWQSLHPAGIVHLMIAELDGETVCGVFFFALSDCVRAWKFGWNGTHAKTHPSEILHWEMIKWAKLNGYRQLDLWQADPIIARAIASGKRPLPDSITRRRLFGPTMHKMGYGGNLLVLPPPYCRFLNPVFNAGYAVVASTLLKNRRIHGFACSVLRRFWNRNRD